MCTGLEIAYAVGAAATVAGTAISYQAQQKQADQADAMAAQQSQQAKDDAQYAASEAQLQARTIRKAADRQRAEARASLAGSGVTVGVGTAEQIDTSIQSAGEEDALMAIYDGTNRARSINQAGQLEASRSRNSAEASRIGAATTALSGVSTLARGWNTSAARK